MDDIILVKADSQIMFNKYERGKELLIYLRRKYQSRYIIY